MNNPTTGHRWEGNGLSRLDGGTTSPSSLNGPTSKIVWNANQITLSGSAGATGSTANDSSATLTVDLSGVTTNELKLWTLRITGGTNFTPGTYTILSVSGNELTLDRDPSSGGAGSDLIGRILIVTNESDPDHVKDHRAGEKELRPGDQDAHAGRPVRFNICGRRSGRRDRQQFAPAALWAGRCMP